MSHKSIDYSDFKRNDLIEIIEKLIEDKDRIMNWFKDGDVGASSKTMANYFSDMIDFEIYYPHDPGDFGRCYKLLIAFPEWKIRILEISALSKQWKNLAENWDRLTEMYEQNIRENWKNSKQIGMYEFMGTLTRIKN